MTDTWPQTAEDATAGAILRHLAITAQRVHLTIEAAGPDAALPAGWMAAATLVHGFRQTLAALRAIDERRADEVARDWWLACEAGDSFGEWAWEWCALTDIDPHQLQPYRA